MNAIETDDKKAKINKPGHKKWIFIVGCYNSGTTLLHNVLATHPDIGSMPQEGQALNDQFPTPKALKIPRLWVLKRELFHLSEDNPPALVADKLKQQWSRHYNNINKPILIEKSITNTARILWLNKHFQEASFIGVIRNGYTVAEGIHRRAGHDFDLGARQWAISNQIMLDDLEQVPRKLIILYEDLVQNPTTTLNTISDFIGVKNTFDKAIKKFKIKNFNPESLSRLSPAAKQKIEREALPLLTKLGYLPTQE